MTTPTSFADVLAKHRERLGGSVTLEEIFALHDAAEGAGSMSDEERVELLDRLAADPEAASKLKALLRFPEMSAPAPPTYVDENVDERWRAFQERLEPVEEIERLETPPPSRLAGLLRWPRNVALAASFILVSALMFWLGSHLTPPSTTTEGAAVRINPVIVELRSSSTVHRGVQQIPWPASAESLVVVLSSADILEPQPMDLVVRDEQGQVLLREAGLLPNEGGLFAVTFDRDILAPGSYVLQLVDEAGRVVESYTIEVLDIP